MDILLGKRKLRSQSEKKGGLGKEDGDKEEDSSSLLFLFLFLLPYAVCSITGWLQGYLVTAED